jgi:uncharacterized membrane protein
MRPPHWSKPLIWVFLLAAAWALASLIPPLQSPDENSHLARAYLISKGELTLTPSDRGSGGRIDYDLLLFIDAYLARVTVAREKIDAAQQARIESFRWGREDRFMPVAGTGYYLPLIYAPHASAIAIGRALDWSVADSYRLVRVFCLLACLGLLAAAWHTLRPPPLAVALLLLPMSMFQLLTPTLDGVSNCLAVLVLSTFMRIMLQTKDVRPADSWLLAGSVALLVSSRNQLLPLLALPLFIAWTRRSRRDAFLGGAAIVLSLAWLAYVLLNTVDKRIPRTRGTGELLVHYLSHPLSFFSVVGTSLADKGLSQQYEQSFIGVLGWLDAQLPEWAYPGLWIGLAAFALASVLLASGQAWLARGLLAFTAVASALLVFFALLVTWTPHPTTFVGGVQGRYFMVPALILAYAIGASPPDRRWNGAIWALLTAFAAASLYALVATVLARYH